ncbi:F-box domain protein [Nile crocodilepox virus]|uniref:F-box domain protein n=1 Tax=Nile crocodilepox virus (isolate Crocodylus niloticus/Zimbabwe/Ume/2001) TaxID=1289473 RepID=Q06ZX1_CPRVZ|nr:F-box domain protein [Nile crocodilepox virus]ABJ08900.1 F-box domain protein [Nile crocodilepox virus]
MDCSASICDLPSEILTHIFLSLPDIDLCACNATCRAWRDVVSAAGFWSRRFRSRFGFAPPPDVDAREVYTEFPHDIDVFPKNLRRACSFTVKLTMKSLGCHACLLDRQPIITVIDRLIDCCRVRLNYGFKVVLLDGKNGVVDQMITKSFNTQMAGSVCYEFRSYEPTVTAIEISRESSHAGTCQLRLSF